MHLYLDFFTKTVFRTRFIQKQGLDRIFVECDTHMYRIGSRDLPSDITLDGGSDWIILHRNFSHYLVNSTDHFLLALKKFYEFTLLPAEVRFCLTFYMWT